MEELKRCYRNDKTTASITYPPSHTMVTLLTFHVSNPEDFGGYVPHPKQSTFRVYGLGSRVRCVDSGFDGSGKCPQFVGCLTQV